MSVMGKFYRPTGSIGNAVLDGGLFFTKISWRIWDYIRTFYLIYLHYRKMFQMFQVFS